MKGTMSSQIRNLLYQCGVPNIDILVEETHKLYFLLTFEGSNFAYFMIPGDYATWYDEHEVFYGSIYGAHFFVPISGERECRIRFESEEHKERREHRFKIKFNSWDNVEFKRSDEN